MAKSHTFLCVILMSFALCSTAQAATAPTDFEHEMTELRDGWADMKYQTTAIQAKQQKVVVLEDEVQQAVDRYPDRAEPKIMQAIILATDAEITRSLTGLWKVIQAKKILEQAITIDPRAMHGVAFVTLGALYYQVPGWPISYGSNNKAEQNFAQGLAIDPNGMDPNYFYGQYLVYRGRDSEALPIFERALAAKPRPGFQAIETPRRIEIAATIETLKRKLATR